MTASEKFTRQTLLDVQPLTSTCSPCVPSRDADSGSAPGIACSACTTQRQYRLARLLDGFAPHDEFLDFFPSSSRRRVHQNSAAWREGRPVAGRSPGLRLPHPSTASWMVVTFGCWPPVPVWRRSSRSCRTSEVWERLSISWSTKRESKGAGLLPGADRRPRRARIPWPKACLTSCSSSRW